MLCLVNMKERFKVQKWGLLLSCRVLSVQLLYIFIVSSCSIKHLFSVNKRKANIRLTFTGILLMLVVITGTPQIPEKPGEEITATLIFPFLQKWGQKLSGFTVTNTKQTPACSNTLLQNTVCLSVCLSICLSVRPFIHPSIHPSIHLTFHQPSICSSTILPSIHHTYTLHPFIHSCIHTVHSVHHSSMHHPFHHPPIHPSIIDFIIHLSIHLSSIHPSIHPHIQYPTKVSTPLTFQPIFFIIFQWTILHKFNLDIF